MVEDVKIESLEQLEEWLKTQDVRVSRTMAAREALRVFPEATLSLKIEPKNNDGATFALACARSTLITCVGSSCPIAKLSELKQRAVVAAKNVYQMERSTLTSTNQEIAQRPSKLRTAANAAYRDAADVSKSLAAQQAVTKILSQSKSQTQAEYVAAETASRIRQCIASLTMPVHTTSDHARASIATECTKALHPDGTTSFQEAAFLKENEYQKLFEKRLFLEDDSVAKPLEAWQRFKLQDDPNLTWSFWKTWYEGYLDGEPLDWQLQLRVALIEDTVWDLGAEAVAQAIEHIRQKWELEREVATLKEQLTESKQLATLPNRLHNQPPEAVDDSFRLFQTDVTLIWDKLVELEVEVQKPNPSPSKLLVIGKWLAEKAVAMSQYCGSVADEWLRAGGKAFAIAAGTAGGAKAVTSIPELMNSISGLAEKLANLLGG